MQKDYLTSTEYWALPETERSQYAPTPPGYYLFSYYLKPPRIVQAIWWIIGIGLMIAFIAFII